MAVDYERLWPHPPVELVLSTNDVHVWRASLAPPSSLLHHLARTLAAEERERAERFYFQRDRDRFVVCRGILRSTLGGYLGVEPKAIRFRYGAYGKPFLADAKANLCFNLSHAHGLALFAFTLDREVGVDVESVRPLPEARQIAEQFFSPGEIAALSQVPPGKIAEAFFNCWTRKEAFIKAKGKGLSWPLAHVEVSLAPGEPARLLGIVGEPREASRWHLQALTPAPGYAAAICVEGSDVRLECWEWPGISRVLSFEL